MKIGVVVEGPSDREVVPILLRKLAPGLGVQVRKAQQGDMLDPKKMEATIGFFLQAHPDLKRVLIFRDCECTDEGKLRPYVREVEAHMGRKFPRPPVRLLLVVHALEAWLMADRKAVEEVLGRGVADRLPHDPEVHCRPKRLLEDLARGKFSPQRDDARLAERLDIQEVVDRCPSFSRTRDAIQDPEERSP